MENDYASHFVHPAAIVEPGALIGEKTRVWAFSHILPGARIGVDCNICDHVFIENNVVIGDRVTIKSGVQIWDGIFIEDDVLIGPNATFTNDPFPRSKQDYDRTLKTVVEKGASIGANATILPDIRIGKNAMVGAGAVVTRNVPPYSIVVGNPARITGYVSSLSQKPIITKPIPFEKEIISTKLRGVYLSRLPLITDIRGDLIFGEYKDQLPFTPVRFFVIFGVPTKEVRGEHAHKTLKEFLICLKGSVNVLLDNGKEQEEVILNDPRIGLFIPPDIWTVQYKYSPDAILLALASDIYDSEDYIREYDDFLAYIKNKEQSLNSQ